MRPVPPSTAPPPFESPLLELLPSGAALTADERELFIRLGTQLADMQADARGSLVELDLGTTTATPRPRPRKAA
jgi:hypothetical protein